MATVIHPQHSHPLFSHRPGVQKICIALGILFVLTGLSGAVQPDLFGMHLSMAHNLILLASGSLSLWTGFADHPEKAYFLSCTLGVAYAAVAIVGYLLGSAGYPVVGDVSSDAHLWRIVPNLLEFGTNDHILHLFIGFIFLLGAFFWKLKVDSISRSIVDIQRRK